MEYRNIIYYLIYFPSIIFLAGFPFYFQIGKSKLGIILYVIYAFILIFILSYIQKKYWSWVLTKRRNKVYGLLNNNFNDAELTKDKQYLTLKMFDRNVLLKFDFSNYPPHRFSTPKNRLKIYLEITNNPKYSGDFKSIKIDNRNYLYESKIFKDFFINRSIENLARNCKKEVRKLIENSKLT